METNDKPCVVAARQGNTVCFRQKFLYSKYNPEKQILEDIAARTFLPGTLVLCVSPCLCYGLHELLEKLPENCVALGVEADKLLHEFTAKFAKAFEDAALTEYGASPQNAKFIFVPREDLANLPLLLAQKNSCLSNKTPLPQKGVLRRCVVINFSAGSSFNSEFYNRLVAACTQSIAQFWKNRITLVQFGRKYSRNLFRNLAVHAINGASFRQMYASVSKPILVVGAGESLETTAREIAKNSDKFFVLAVDAAANALAARGIVPDAVVCEEAQVAIAPAFLGFLKNAEKASALPSTHGKSLSKTVTFFSGISSWTGLAAATQQKNNGKIKSRVSYFATRYDDSIFFDSLTATGFFPPEMPPLGSVGLTATEIALRLRQNEAVPIFVTGLDFSYSIGKTHANGTPHHLQAVFSATKLTPPGNYAASFGLGAEIFVTTEQKKRVTTKALNGYAQIFAGYFGGTKNLFDCRANGLPLGLEKKSLKDFLATQNFTELENHAKGQTDKTSAQKTEAICQWLKNERSELQKFRDILTGQAKIAPENLGGFIEDFLKAREYLYLHFPDGFAPSLEESFLKRIRAEIDFFMKDLKIALDKIEEIVR